MDALVDELKLLIIDSLDLEDIQPEQIEPDAPLFGDGLGLDSIDALELGVAVQKRFGIKLDARAADNREHFRSVVSLAHFVAAHRQQ